MAKRKFQMQKGYRLFDFIKHYGTKAQCDEVLFTWHFPHGFVCPELCQQDILPVEKLGHAYCNVITATTSVH